MVAEQQLCTFLIQEILFGINVHDVQEVIRPHTLTPVPLAPPDICGLINLRGQILTVIDLQQRLDMGKSTMGLPAKLIEDPPGFYIVVCVDEQIVSLLVDDVGDVFTLPAETFQPPPATLTGRMRQLLAGAYPLATGFLLVLDTAKVLNFNVKNSFIQ
ncbi:CheW protein [Calothrix brevissima NIES-22]|nr:CheW protein [Calothrix brevissima NIES-22]